MSCSGHGQASWDDDERVAIADRQVSGLECVVSDRHVDCAPLDAPYPMPRTAMLPTSFGLKTGADGAFHTGDGVRKTAWPEIWLLTD